MFEKLWTAAKSKLGYALIAAALGGLKAAFPDAPLPSVDAIMQGAALLVGAHTATDIAVTIASLIAETMRHKAALVAPQKSDRHDTGLTVPMPAPRPHP